MTVNILLVEDNSADAELLMELLEDNENDLSIDWVSDGTQALDFVNGLGKFKARQRPDLILLDLSLPRVTGYDVLKQIKQQDEHKNIPVIILSTSANPTDMNECKNLGAEGFISKPHNLQGYENLAEHLVLSELPKFARV